MSVKLRNAVISLIPSATVTVMLLAIVLLLGWIKSNGTLKLAPQPEKPSPVLELKDFHKEFNEYHDLKWKLEAVVARVIELSGTNTASAPAIISLESRVATLERDRDTAARRNEHLRQELFEALAHVNNLNRFASNTIAYVSHLDQEMDRLKRANTNLLEQSTRAISGAYQAVQATYVHDDVLNGLNWRLLKLEPKPSRGPQ